MPPFHLCQGDKRETFTCSIGIPKSHLTCNGMNDKVYFIRRLAYAEDMAEFQI